MFFWFYEKRYLSNKSRKNIYFFYLTNKNFYFLWKNNLTRVFIYKYKNFTLNLKKKIKKSYILNSLKKSFYLTKNKNKFVSNRYSFIFLSNNSVFNNKKVKLKYTLKKNIFSFSYKNEVQKYILRKYSRFSLFNNFNVLKFNNFNKINNLFNLNFSFINNDYLSLFFRKNNSFTYILSKNFKNSNWSYFNDQINYSINNENDLSNFNIKRIKFKPGYMTMWRDARKVVKTSLNLKIKYQYKLTNYLSKYKKFIKFKTFLFSEMRLLNILIKSRLFNDYNLTQSFINSNLVFLNGFSCINPNMQVFSGDFIQLVINLKYYILFRWFNTLALKRKNKIRNVLRKKNSNFNKSDEKKKSYSLPKWILFSKNTIDDVSNYLETDYFTLSIFVLYEPFLWTDLNSYNLIDQKFGIINLYNWKYLT
jgi:hypothetical protein